MQYDTQGGQEKLHDGSTVPSHEHTTHHGLTHMKVFVVEDSAPVRERLIEMIDEIDGCQVVGYATSFEGAVSGIGRTRPDVAIFDIQLAAGSGIEALAEAKRECPLLKSIMLTNYATPQHEKASVEAGADYFLDKSADFDSIPGILESMKAEQDGASN